MQKILLTIGFITLLAVVSGQATAEA